MVPPGTRNVTQIGCSEAEFLFFSDFGTFGFVAQLSRSVAH
jgi:hypothetical protein